MASNKFGAWFLTDAGKKCAYYLAGTASTVCLLGHVLPHTVLLDKYKDVVHLYKNGFTVPLPPKLHKRFEDTLELLQLNEKDRQLFKPFSAYGFDIFSAGSSYSQFGVIVGLPANFAYDSVDSIDKSAIKLKAESIVWELDEAKQLLNSLVLSEEAQQYAMAREIKLRETPKQLIDTAFSVLAVTGFYGLSQSFNQRLNLYVKPVGVRIVLYLLCGAFSFGSYALSKDFSQVYYERKVDVELTAKSPVFVKGGKEFYEKILLRNVALRKLLGKEGESAYTLLGNENYLLRYRHIPLVQRKSFFEEIDSDSQLSSV